MKYEIHKNGECVGMTNDLVTAMVNFQQTVEKVSNDMAVWKTDTFLCEVELRFIEEKKKMMFKLELTDIPE